MSALSKLAIILPTAALTVLFSDAALAASDPAPAVADDSTSHAADMVWVLTCAALVFLMQAGFLVMELGLVRTKNTVVVALKNVGDWMIVSIAFFVVGFALMFGESTNGYFGTTFGLLDGIDEIAGSGQGSTHLSWAFVVFQLAFCGTAATIVSGAMAERTGFKAYLLFCVVMGGLIYPVFGHWAWGSMFLGPDNAGWLEKLGYHDFAGSGVVHSIGAWASLVGVWMVGPRLGRYGMQGQLNRMDCNSIAWSGFGTLILWFGWWGFNGGSALAVSSDIGRIILVTNLSGAAAGIVGFAHAQLVQGRRNIEEKLIGSTIGGLVAITAGCDIIDPVQAIAVGAIAGVLHNIGFELVIRRWRLDDVVGAVPVHGVCGVWGVLAVGIFGTLPDGVDRLEQIGVQVLGCAVAFLWTTSISFVTFAILRRWVGLRVNPMAEIEGIALSNETAGPRQDPGDLDGDEGLGDEMDELMRQVREHVREGEKLDAY